MNIQEINKEIHDCKAAIMETCTNADYLTGYISALSAVEGMLAELEQSDWIPCSEGLPKESGSYLATVLCWGEPTVYKKYFTTIGSEPNRWLTNFKVTAWMPLPEPYKGE